MSKLQNKKKVKEKKSNDRTKEETLKYVTGQSENSRDYDRPLFQPV